MTFELGFQHLLVHRFPLEGHAASDLAGDPSETDAPLLASGQLAPLFYDLFPVHE